MVNLMSNNLACPFGFVREGKKVVLNIDEAIKLLEDKNQSKNFDRVTNFNVFAKDVLGKDSRSAEEFLNSFFEKLSRKKVKESFTRDKLVVQAITYTETLDEVINSLFERVYEWFSLYYPEAALKLESAQKFGSVVSSGIDRKKLAKRLNVSLESMGADLTGEDLKTLEEIVKDYETLISTQDRTKKYVEKIMREIAPNLSEVATPLLGAKLIKRAGGLDRLAKVPSSTIQVMGAEKALFMHLKTKSKPPKHGIILQHPLLLNAPQKHKGKLARTLASKISIAAKEDYYGDGKTMIAEGINKKLKERAKKIMKDKK